MIPAAAPGGMFVQSEKFVESHGGKLGDISIYGQESNATTRRLAVMNLAIRGIEADFGPEHADIFRPDLHPDLRAEYVLANGSMSSNQSGEGDIRRALINTNVVDCMVALPGCREALFMPHRDPKICTLIGHIAVPTTNCCRQKRIAGAHPLSKTPTL
jgi:type I restriction-modification system DNA methylase subunit